MPSRITIQENTILQWTLGSLAIVVTCGRYYLRWRHSCKARLDDLFNGLALLCLLAYFAICQAKWSTLDPISALKLWLAQNLLFWTCLYLVKATFLTLYWIIFNISASFRRAWLAVALFNLISFLAIFLCQLWQCGNPLLYADQRSCENFSNLPPGVLSSWDIAGFVLSFALHIPSDCLLVALPMLFLKKLYMSRSRKVGVAAVLSIGIIDTVLGLARLIALLCGSLDWPVPADVSRDAIFDVIGIVEPAVAVILCALPVYKVLLPSVREPSERKPGLPRNAATMGTFVMVKSSQSPLSLVRETDIATWV